jgi:CRP/FNR family transcriptional regulator, anaerobic regulatory protein
MHNQPDETEQILKQLLNIDSLLISELAQFFNPKEFSQNEYFLKEGQAITKMGIIVKGVARLFNVDELGNEATIYLLSEGNFVMGSFVPEKESSVTIQCITDSTILIADYNKLLNFMEGNNKLKHFFESYLSRAHHSILSRLSHNLRLDAKDRYLLFLQEYPNLINRIPHYHIANYLGISTTQLSRIRHKLAKET